MNVTCPSCETVYRVDPAKVPAGGVRARCAVCSNVFPVNASAGAAAPAAVAAGRPPAAPAPAPPAPAPAPPRAPAMPRFSGPIAAPTSAPAPPAPPVAPAPPPRAAPPPAPPRAAPPAAPARAPAAPPAAPTMRPAAPPAAPPPRAGRTGRAGRRRARPAHDEPAPSGESVHGAGSEAEGTPTRAGPRFGSRGVPSGETPAGAAGRHAAAALQRRDREKLAGIRRAGGSRAREGHTVLGRGAERDSRRGKQGLLGWCGGV